MFLVLLVACGAHVHHQVKKHETLYSIGWKYGIDFRSIAHWNAIAPPFIIREGQWIRVAPQHVPWWKKQHFDAVEKSEVAIDEVKEQENQVSSIAESTIINPKKNFNRIEKQPISDQLQWRWPTRGSIVKRFSLTSPRYHGIAITGVRGQTIVSAAAGRVVYSGSGLNGYGKLIIVKHNKLFLSAYGHNDEVLVKEGDDISIGQSIAKMGSSGAERVLLHFEIRQNGTPVNPLQFLQGRY